jgi:hypothetical protein
MLIVSTISQTRCVAYDGEDGTEHSERRHVGIELVRSEVLLLNERID